LIELESYWEPPKVKSAFPNAKKDLYEKQALIEAMKERGNIASKMNSNKSSMYSMPTL
jgi:hypothetical protein